MKTATILLLLACVQPGMAQVTVTQAPPEANGQVADIAVPCPMQVDVYLGARPELRRRSFGDMPLNATWLNDEMKHHVCHTERITQVFLRKTKEKRGQVSFLTQLRVMSEQWRQDVDLTVSIVTPSGEVHCLESKDNLTVGKDRAISNVTWVTMASRTKMPEFPCAMASSDFVGMFADGQAPTLRIVLAPELEDGNG